MRRGPKPKGQVTVGWSPQFAYAIGLLTADGCLSSDGRHIDFTSKDQDQVETFKECLKLKVKIGLKSSGTDKTYYHVQFGDVLLYAFLESIGLSPAKSKTISSVLVPDAYFSDFLRGYFDGDGTSYSFYDPVFPQSYRFYVSFISASSAFIDWLRGRINGLVGGRGHLSAWAGRNHTQLRYAKRESITICQYMYQREGSPFLRRKYLKIQRSLRIISQCRGGEIGIHANFRS